MPHRFKAHFEQIRSKRNSVVFIYTPFNVRLTYKLEYVIQSTIFALNAIMNSYNICVHHINNYKIILCIHQNVLIKFPWTGLSKLKKKKVDALE